MGPQWDTGLDERQLGPYLKILELVLSNGRKKAKGRMNQFFHINTTSGWASSPNSLWLAFDFLTKNLHLKET